MRNTLPDLSDLGRCERTVIRLILRQQSDRHFAQGMMYGLCFIDAQSLREFFRGLTADARRAINRTVAKRDLVGGYAG